MQPSSIMRSRAWRRFESVVTAKIADLLFLLFDFYLVENSSRSFYTRRLVVDVRSINLLALESGCRCKKPCLECSRRPPPDCCLRASTSAVGFRRVRGDGAADDNSSRKWRQRDRKRRRRCWRSSISTFTTRPFSANIGRQFDSASSCPTSSSPFSIVSRATSTRIARSLAACRSSTSCSS